MSDSSHSGLDPVGPNRGIEPKDLVPTTAKVHETILNFERDGQDADDVDMKYQFFRESLETIQDRIRYESQSRVESMNVLQKNAEKMANDLLFKFHNEIFKRIDSISVELRNALEKAKKLESSLNELKKETSMVFMNDLAVIQQQLALLTKDFYDQCNISREIDESILSRATQVDKSTSEFIAVQYSDLQSVIVALDDKIEKTITRLKLNQGNLCANINQELQALSKALELATQARRDSDECIVQAISEMVNLLPKESQLPNDRTLQGGEISLSEINIDAKTP